MCIVKLFEVERLQDCEKIAEPIREHSSNTEVVKVRQVITCKVCALSQSPIQSIDERDLNLRLEGILKQANKNQLNKTPLEL